MQVLQTSAYRGTVRLPYCLLDGQGGLRTYPPEGYPMWPLRQDLAVAALLEESYFAFVTRHRSEQKRPVTERLIEEMNATVRARGSRFLVVYLAGARNVAAHYATYLADHGIGFVDCAFGGGLTVPGEGHPNGLANTKWADCIARVLDADFAVEPPRD
jgi:hypothetical protein